MRHNCDVLDKNVKFYATTGKVDFRPDFDLAANLGKYLRDTIL